jgi:hypothetical protein
MLIVIVTSSDGDDAPAVTVYAPSPAPLASAGGDAVKGAGTCTERPPGFPDTEYTCEQQLGWGKCDVAEFPWMRGYCCSTCFACDRECTSVWNFQALEGPSPSKGLGIVGSSDSTYAHLPPSNSQSDSR